ncbi:MAG TPA: T9SS type A sorting domain-containing protein, partial [Chitinophagaceae bacterium]
CGSSTTNCITVTGPPSTPGAISGIYSVCSRQKNVVYTVPLLPGATSYTWAVPSQATIVSGQGSNTISVTFGVKTGNITVKASNSCGSSALQTLAINMNCTGANAIATVAVALAAQPVRLVTKISVYPNPSTGRITLEFIRLPSLTYQVSVLDVLGQSVYSQVLNGQGNSVTLDLAHLRKGVYLLRLFNGYSYKEVTIVIQ